MAALFGLGMNTLGTQEAQASPAQTTYEVQDLGTLGGALEGAESVAFGINDSGQVVGTAYTNDGLGGEHAFLYDESATPKMKDLGTLGGPYSGAYSINNSGQVVGYSYTTGSSIGHAFLYDESATPKMKDLGHLGSYNYSEALDINDSGQVVGHAYANDSRLGPAFLYENGQMIDLNTLIPADAGWTLSYAYGINNYGHIAAIGYKDSSVYRERHALLLTQKTADNTLPVIIGLPTPDLTVKATSASGANVSFPSSIAAYDGNETVPVRCASASGLKSGDTFPIGETTVNCSATDAAGNNAQASFTVKVRYDFGNGSGGGFSSPVSGSVLNTVKAGQGVPVKFGLGGDFGLDMFYAGYPMSRKIGCDTGLPTDPVEETVSISTSDLHYDTSAGQYIYNWKTDRAWSGTCREFIIKFKDGTEHPAKFEFTK